MDAPLVVRRASRAPRAIPTTRNWTPAATNSANGRRSRPAAARRSRDRSRGTPDLARPLAARQSRRCRRGSERCRRLRGGPGGDEQLSRCDVEGAGLVLRAAPPHLPTPHLPTPRRATPRRATSGPGTGVLGSRHVAHCTGAPDACGAVANRRAAPIRCMRSRLRHVRLPASGVGRRSAGVRRPAPRGRHPFARGSLGGYPRTTTHAGRLDVERAPAARRASASP